MAETSKIEWTDATYNPITGCSVVSPGCTNCYAMRLAGTRLKHHPSRAGLTTMSKAGPVWNGEVRFNEQWLDQPLRWRKPRMIFVCAHGDLFHESVPDEWIDRVFAVMALAPQHTFQVLTKRSDRMRDYINYVRDSARYLLWQHPIFGGNAFDATCAQWENMTRHIWLGVSAEDQTRANERIPDLLATPAAVRFLSAEPLLAPINFDLEPGRFIRCGGCGYTERAKAELMDHDLCKNPSPALDWIILGGESGRKARDMIPDWARSIRDQCKAAGVSFFMKQMARKTPIPEDLMVREMPSNRNED